MAEAGVYPGAVLVRGADWGVNGSRQQPVRAPVLHTTQGNDSRGLGSGRHHSSPGTFNFLVRDEAVYQYYPATVRCSHAAGANRAGPGIENEGFTGRPLSAGQIAGLGGLLRWLRDTYGVPATYRTGDPRIYVDNVPGFHGFISHRAVDYPPDTSLRHYDEITPDEFRRAIGAVQPVPEPPKPKDDDMAWSGKIKGTEQHIVVSGVFYHRVDGATILQRNNPSLGPAHIEFRGSIPTEWLDDMIDADTLATGTGG